MLPDDQLNGIKAVLQGLHNENLVIIGLSKDKTQVHTVSFMSEELLTKLSGSCIIDPGHGVQIARIMSFLSQVQATVYAADSEGGKEIH
jgi:hypothetical protein